MIGTIKQIIKDMEHGWVTVKTDDANVVVDGR